MILRKSSLRCLPSLSCRAQLHSFTWHAGSTLPHTRRHQSFISRAAPHDVGGARHLEAADVPADAPMTAWELEAHSLMVALSAKRVISTDELRRAIEALPTDAYVGWGYYEKWSAAIATLLQEKQLLKPGELEAVLFGDVGAAAKLEPRFSPGEHVTVRSEEAARTSWRRPHLRTPGYVHGATGTIERLCGRFGDPALLAYGVCGPQQFLYRVRFAKQDLWEEEEPSLDTVDVEVYEGWLLPAASAAPKPTSLQRSSSTRPGAQPQLQPLREHRCDALDVSGQVDSSGAQHHGAHEHEHVHLRRQIEAEAVEAEGEARPGSALHEALVTILVDKGQVVREELQRIGEKMMMAGRELPAASLVARAWLDDGFKRRLLADAPSAAAELGIDTRNPNAPTQLTVVANDAETHNLVVCTL
mmetsp:Transcript_58530/g.134288  ORF Transcript_58530/g.134288 Transcript_58530/m.134288 type:complete len:416 (-) Transcript_58530:1150-2397(-)